MVSRPTRRAAGWKLPQVFEIVEPSHGFAMAGCGALAPAQVAQRQMMRALPTPESATSVKISSTAAP
jgi:hypothetical protein